MIAQLSDLHVTVGHDDHDSAAALEAAVRAVLALRTPPDAVVITGDLAEHGDPREYARVRELLAPLPMPVHVLPGNQDDRDALREAFGLPGASGEPVRGTARCGPLRLVACDTMQPGRDDGRLDLAWLASALAEDPATPTIIAMHHPPVEIGIPVLDAIGLPPGDRDALRDLLARWPQVRGVVCGHVHRSAFATLGGCGVVTLGGASMQVRLDFAAREFEGVHQPPLIAIHALVGDELVSHLQPVAGDH